MTLSVMGISLLTTTLSRWQFAITAGFHFMFVGTSIGLMLVTVVLESLYAFKKNGAENYGRLAKFYGRIFLYSFATGVVTGLFMELQFGLNWSGLSKFLGDIMGAPLAIESMAAFFMESTLIGVWIITWETINRKLHFFIGASILFSSLFSVVWIIAINAFMQNPVGFTIKNGRARLTSIINVLQNPQYLPEAMHVFIATVIIGGFTTMGIAAWQIIHNRDAKLFKRAIMIGMLVALPAVLMQPYFGDGQGKTIAAGQPMKFSAMEALWQDTPKNQPAPWAAAALINEKNHTTKALDIPRLSSYFATGNFNSKVQLPGMETIAKTYDLKFNKNVAKSYDGQMKWYPQVHTLYWSMRWMFYFGYIFMTIVVSLALLLFRDHDAFSTHKKTLRLLGYAMWLPYITAFLGWVVAEVGRYPFVVYGIITQYDSVSANLKPVEVGISLTLIVLIDAFLLFNMIKVNHNLMLTGVPEIKKDTSTIFDPFAKGVFTHE
ncbi:cytochrome ubiquinol oxidase subunit I [Companilactobacillus sp. DQM5]|uniref:cytochrome ubiquinol oxidase subunit I n=1 Tax=Companilactobacillus sp. DQM5 TaxID=3463359 RepID=UPI004057F62E